MSGRHQQGYIWKKGRAWYGRWYEDVMVGGNVVRKARAQQLAPYNDRYRNKTDVRPILDAVLRPINDGHSDPAGTLTVANYYEKIFLPHIQTECKPSTQESYTRFWKRYLSSELQSAVMRDFRCVDATNLLAVIHKKYNIGRTSLRHCKALLSSMFTIAKQRGAIDGVNPIIGAGLPKHAPKSKPTKASTVDEVLAMLSVLKGDSRTAVALVYFCGLRPGEARGVRWEDYDGNKLYVRRSIWRTHVTTPKTEDSVSPVEVCATLRVILDAHRQGRVTGYILAGPTGKPKNLDNLASRVVVPQLRAANIQWAGWYGFRRGIATTATSVGSAIAAKGLLRHSNISTTQQFYIKDSPADTRRALKKIDKLFATVGR